MAWQLARMAQEEPGWRMTRPNFDSSEIIFGVTICYYGMWVVDDSGTGMVIILEWFSMGCHEGKPTDKTVLSEHHLQLSTARHDLAIEWAQLDGLNVGPQWDHGGAFMLCLLHQLLSKLPQLQRSLEWLGCRELWDNHPFTKANGRPNLKGYHVMDLSWPTVKP